MSQYFPQLFKSFAGNINVKVDLLNNATKTNLKKKQNQKTKIELEKKIPGLTDFVKKKTH